MQGVSSVTCLKFAHVPRYKFNDMFIIHLTGEGSAVQSSFKPSHVLYTCKVYHMQGVSSVTCLKFIHMPRYNFNLMLTTQSVTLCNVI